MSSKLDLHMHTFHSDGAYSPESLMAIVRAANLVAFSVTDHDTMRGYHDVTSLLKPGDPELIPGVELSVTLDDTDIHMLAYLFDPHDTEFTAALEDYRVKREARGRQMVEKLRNLGLDITFDQVALVAGDSVIGRPHVATTLHQLGHTSVYEQAFYKYIGPKGPAYVPKAVLRPEDAIALVHRAGGVTVLAHPFIADTWRFLDRLVPLGLDGLEVWHYSQDTAQSERLKTMARKYNLVTSGGSDFHGRDAREGTVGSVRVPLDVLDRLKERAQRIRGHA